MPRWGLGALLLMYVVVQGLPFLEGFRLTADDVEYHSIVMSGEHHFWEFVRQRAESQGRIVHYFDVPVALVAAYFAENVYFRLFYTAFHFLTLALFARFAALLSRQAIGALLLVVLVAFQPLDYFHLPPNAYPFHVSLPVGLILVSRICLLGLRRQGDQGLKPALPLHGLAFVGVMFGEGAFLFFIALVVMEALVELPAGTHRGGSVLAELMACVRTYRSECVVGLLFVILYLAYRSMHPSLYGGNQLSGAIDVAAFGKTLLGHIYGGTSLAALVRNTPQLIAQVPSLNGFVWFVAAAILVGVSMLFWSLASRTELQSLREHTTAPWYRLLLGALFGAVLVTVPLALVLKYQRWCASIHACVFHDSRLSYYFTCLVLLALILMFSDRLRQRGWWGPLLARGLGVAIGAVATLTYLNNEVKSLDMSDYAAGWRRAKMAACLKTENFSPDVLGTLIDPRRRVSMHPDFDRNLYWSRYVTHLRSHGVSCDAGQSISDLSPRLPTGSRVLTNSSGQGAVYLGEGWSWPEAGHVWSQAGAVQLLLPLDREQRGFRMELMGFVSPAHPRQRVQVRIDQREMMAFVVGNSDVRRIDIPVDSRAWGDDPGQKSRLFVVELLLPDAVSPNELGMGGDQRELGIGLVSLSAQ